MTIVELCRIDDKKASTFVEIAVSQGRNVYSFRGHYVVLLAENNFWRVLRQKRHYELKAAGWKYVGPAGGGSWSRPSRKRDDKAPLQPKQLWEATA